jgi:hypothetical protein
LQGISAEVLAKAENLGADTLQLGTISAFNWITFISTEAGRLDYYKAFLGLGPHTPSTRKNFVRSATNMADNSKWNFIEPRVEDLGHWK